MLKNKDQHQPVRRSNSLNDEPVRRVTIQQRVVQPPSSSVATTDHSENVRRYPKVEYHDPSGRGHRGKHWAKPTRGVVANIVNSLESGGRKLRGDGIRTGINMADTLPRERVSGLQRTGDRLSNDVRELSEEGSDIALMTKETVAVSKTGEILSNTKADEKQSNVAMKTKESIAVLNTGEKLTHAASRSHEKQSDAALTTKERDAVSKTGEELSHNTTRVGEKQSVIALGVVEDVTENLPTSGNEDTAIRLKTDASISNSTQANERKRLENEQKIARSDISNFASKTGVILPVVAPKPKRYTSKAKVRTSMTTEMPSKPAMKTSEVGFENEEKASDSTLWVEERKLWEKAVKEFQQVISDKELVIDNLSKVNCKLSEDIEHYEGSMKDCKKRLRIVEGEREVTGDSEGYQRIIEEREEKIRELEDKRRITDNREKQEYQRVIEEREKKIRELEEKLNDMYQLDQPKRISLELSHGSQNVLKTLELKREKAELEKKVEELQERLKFYESTTSQNQAYLLENDTTQVDTKIFQEIPSLLYKFQNGIATKLQENAQVVSNLEAKLIKCVQNCDKLTKLNKHKTSLKPVIQNKISKESSQQVQCTTEIGLEENFQTQSSSDIPTQGILPQQDFIFGDVTLGDLSLGNGISEESPPCTSDNSRLDETHDQNLSRIQAELHKERMINENLMERFIELEELSNDYQESIKTLERKANDAEDLRTQNETLLGEISELKEKYPLNINEDVDGLKGKDEGKIGSYKDQVSSLQSTLEWQESEIKELREKIVEDEELIEELRANYQREEKWNREMQRNYEWELSTSACKDDRIEEFQDCLWAREKMVQELEQQLDFEDKRCEELLEKLIASQKDAEDFQEMSKDLKKKLEDKENRIKEFCEQNDRDAATISNLTSENKQLRLDVEILTKARRNLEEDLERVNGCLEAVEADKENFMNRQENEVKKLCDELEDKEFTSKGKDEVIEKLQEDVVLLSADVEEMEFKIVERRIALEEDLEKARNDITERDKNIEEALIKYKELQEVCECLRETISVKEGDVLEHEAVMAHQREIIEGHEKEIESLRRICGDNSTPLNNKPELVYTESEMEEVTELLEQERAVSEILRKQISFLENELGNVRTSLKDTTAMLEESKGTLTAARNEISEHESRLEKTETELSMANKELTRIKIELALREKELDENTNSTMILQVDLTEMNTKNHLLEAVKESTENELVAAKQQLEKLHKKIEELELEIRNEDESKRSQNIDKHLEENEKMQQITTDIKLDQKELKMRQNCENEQNENEKNAQVKTEEYKAELTDNNKERNWTENSAINDHVKQQVENKLKNESHVLKSEINELKQDRKRQLQENNELKLSLRELQASNETIGIKNTELQSKIEQLSAKYLRSEEQLRQAQITNVNLRYTIEEYVAQSQDQIRHLKNHEREVATLTEHIHEMDLLVQGFKTSLQKAVENESKTKENFTKDDQNSENKRHLKDTELTGTQKDACGTPVIKSNIKMTVSPQKLSDSVDETSKDNNAASMATVPDHNIDSKDDNISNVVPNNQSRFEVMKTFYEKILQVKVPKNVILLLIFLILVFCLGCTNNSMISRKYLFVFANSFITLIFFALWVNEIHKKKYKAMNTIFGDKVNFQTINGQIRKDGGQSSQVIFQCENCGGGVTTESEECQRYEKIKSSFQELHEKFLEAVENSGRNTLPIQELYEKYEKLKEDVEGMKKERLQKDITNLVSEKDEVSSNDNLLLPKWNEAATILGKTLVITLLCEVLYIRGIYFLPYAANLVSFLVSLMTFSYFYETSRVASTTHDEPCVTQREMILENEIEELNHIIDKEHELVTTQGEAIKALEKRLRKEFEKRIKQRNVLLKKLKFKGKLEDLRDLLGNEEQDEHKGATQDNNQNQQANVDSISMTSKDSKIQEGINLDTNDLKTENLHVHWDTDEHIRVYEYERGGEVDKRINKVTTTNENRISKQLQEIFARTEEQSLDYKFLFSPMFFFLGLPLTAILLSCKYITLSILMIALQATVFVKETKFIEIKTLPTVLQKDINPIVMDTIVVLYACFLALCLQCTQSIVVLITCAVVQLAVHWWTSYRLAKREDTLHEIAVNCLTNFTKQK